MKCDCVFCGVLLEVFVLSPKKFLGYLTGCVVSEGSSDGGVNSPPVFDPLCLDDSEEWRAFCNVVDMAVQQNLKKGERLGQATFNAVFAVRRNLVSTVGGDCDPFHDDSLLPFFWRAVHVGFVDG